MTPPDQTVTFLFTDIEGSTTLWQSHPEEMGAALARHDCLLEEIVESHDGHLFKNTGDGIAAAFRCAESAAGAAVTVQRFVGKIDWGLPDPLRLRCALHTGDAKLRDGDYYGLALSRAARILEVGHGGQILCSGATEQLLRHHPSTELNIVPLGSVRLKNLQRPEPIFQLTVPGLEEQFEPVRSLETHAHNLPIQLTSFVGRAAEVDEVRNAVRGSRLVTIIGPGGSGKTRIAYHAAGRLVGDFEGGVWAVDLSAITEPSHVAPAVASALGVLEEPGVPLYQSISEKYSGGNVLILLDNCEQIVDAVARTAYDILMTCEHVKILTTSRESLNLPGEALVWILPMSLPQTGEPVVAAEILDNDCVHLFAERAAAVSPGFLVTDSNAAAVVQICRRLDGIPLAIELAAARADVFTAEQIAVHITDHFRLSSRNFRKTPKRQRSLEAAIDWSYDLLTEEEQLLFRRLAVFTGGWSVDAAEEVCSGEGLDRADIVNLLHSLVRKSVVTVVDNGRLRYRLLESLRSYALAKRSDAEEGSMNRRHAEWCLARVFDGEDGDRRPLLEDLDDDIDNVRAAIRFSKANDTVLCLKLLAGMCSYWYEKGSHSESITTLVGALENARQVADAQISSAGHVAQKVKQGFGVHLTNALRSAAATGNPTIGQATVPDLGALYQDLTKAVRQGVAQAASLKQEFTAANANEPPTGEET